MKYTVTNQGKTVDVEATGAESKPDTTLLHFTNLKGEVVATFRNWDYYVAVPDKNANYKDANYAGNVASGYQVPNTPGADHQVTAVPGQMETKHYADGTQLTGPAPQPNHSASGALEVQK